MIRSDYILVRDRIRYYDSIASMVDINGNYYKRYSSNKSPIAYKTNRITNVDNRILIPTKRYINITTIGYGIKNMIVVLLKERPREFHHKGFKIKSSTITFEEL